MTQGGKMRVVGGGSDRKGGKVIAINSTNLF